MEHIAKLTTKHGKKLEKATIHSLWNMFKSVVNTAIRGKFITDNPLLIIKPPKINAPHIIYLTLDELKSLVKTPYRYEILKRAFIFSCLTGLRWSDVYKLKWSEVVERDGKYFLEYRQKKTSEVNYLPLPEQSIIYLGERGDGSDRVFNLPVYNNDVSIRLQEWGKSAGINKKIKYHSSRHTFAVLQLSHGTPIYTVQKLLGHTDISSTQVYANIVDSEKEKAMERIPSIL